METTVKILNNSQRSITKASIAKDDIKITCTRVSIGLLQNCASCEALTQERYNRCKSKEKY